MERFYPNFTRPGTDEAQERICRERVRLLYGVDPPGFFERLEAALGMTKGTNHRSVYMLLHHLAKHLHQRGYRLGMRGAFGSALASFLLGITEENPLPAHYRCLSCKYTQWMRSAASGYDLPAEICPLCGRKLHCDGVPQWYIDSMQRITYLLCSSHLV